MGPWFYADILNEGVRRSLIARRTTLQCPRSRSTEANNKRMSIYRQLCMLLFKLITGRTSERLLSSNRKRQDNHRSMYSYLCSMNWHGSAASRLCHGTHLITRTPMPPCSNTKAPPHLQKNAWATIADRGSSSTTVANLVGTYLFPLVGDISNLGQQVGHPQTIAYYNDFKEKSTKLVA